MTSSDAPQSTDVGDAWRKHCLGAVRRFVMNAVVIDNQPRLDTRDAADTTVPQTAVATEDGMELNGTDTDIDDIRVTTNGDPTSANDEVHPRLQDLDIRGISDAFAQEEISCAFVLPDETNDDDAIVKRSLVAAIPSDMLVLDWYLRDKDPGPSQRILRAIAENDVAERGRMRLICIYTGQPLTAEILRLAKRCLEEGGLSFGQCDGVCSAHGTYHCLMVLNKQEIGTEQLPAKLLEGMTKLANGLLPAFSMAAVAAVRRNMHHIIARFASGLDAAFVANMLITDPPTEVAELMRELFVSECDTALGLEGVLDNYLGRSQVNCWFDQLGQPKTTKSFSNIDIDKVFLGNLLQNGLSEGFVSTDNHGKVKFPEKQRCKISQALHGEDGASKAGEGNLARFVVLKREAFGNTKFSAEDWLPSLTLGTLIRQDNNEGDPRYYYCLTPACDTGRLPDKERTFHFLELNRAKKSVNLLVAEEDDKLAKLFIDPKPIYLRSFLFRGNAVTGRVQAKRMAIEGSADLIFSFESAEAHPTKFIWLGETRRNRANRDMAELNRNWLRLGIKDSEYLRLSGKGEFPDLIA